MELVLTIAVGSWIVGAICMRNLFKEVQRLEELPRETIKRIADGSEDYEEFMIGIIDEFKL